MLGFSKKEGGIEKEDELFNSIFSFNINNLIRLQYKSMP